MRRSSVCQWLEPWTIDNGMITPTMKLKRKTIHEENLDEIAKMYEGH
jgi:long-chain acyl-CoA synthetase